MKEAEEEKKKQSGHSLGHSKKKFLLLIRDSQMALCDKKFTKQKYPVYQCGHLIDTWERITQTGSLGLQFIHVQKRIRLQRKGIKTQKEMSSEGLTGIAQDREWDISVVVSGAARGSDTRGD